jgi:hypothetical protein
MKKYIFSGAALLMGALASPGYSATIILNFDGNANGNVNGVPCSTTVTPFSCISITGKGAALSPPGVNPQFAATLGVFGNIIFNELTVSGDPTAALNGVFAFNSSGTGFTYSGTNLTSNGSVTSGALSGTTINVTDATPTVVATVDSGFTEAPVYFANGTVSLSGSLLAALGVTGPFTATLGSDGGTGIGTGCNYPEGARDPQTTGPAAGSFAGGCAAGFGNGGSTFGAESQYLEVVISTTTATPEAATSLMLGLGLVAVGSLARERCQKV